MFTEMHSRSMPQELKIIFMSNMQGFPLASFSITALPHELTLPLYWKPTASEEEDSDTWHITIMKNSPDTFKQRETESCAKKKMVTKA